MGSDECIIWVSEKKTKKKRSTAQVYSPIYHVEEPIVLYNDKVLLALPHLLHRNSTVARRVTKVTPERYGDP